jgi:apolipoprotein N-acyltransferase
MGCGPLCATASDRTRVAVPLRSLLFLFFQIKTTQKDNSMTLVIYLLGWLILIGGVSWALVAMHVAQHTIMIVDVILLGIAVITGATRARNRDRS